MRIVGVGLMAFMLTGCGPAPQTYSVPPRPPRAEPVPNNSYNAEQVLMVWPAGGDPFKVKLSAWQPGTEGWSEMFGPMLAVIGPKGFAPRGEKREGDGRTPSGVFRIGTAFGYDPTIETKLDYRQATADDYWVDDPDSPQYNRWVTGRPEAKSFELLRQDAYKRAAVIEYNTDPVVPGHGSAIFLHVWGGPDKPTAGCVAVSEKDLINLLPWLDRDRHPVIVLNP